jgi:ribosomal protein S27AE
MRWATADVRRGKRPPGDARATPLDAHIREGRLRREALRALAPARRAEADALEARAAAATGRWQARERVELTQRVAALRRELDRVESGEHLAEFERRVAPYAHAHVQQYERRRAEQRHNGDAPKRRRFLLGEGGGSSSASEPARGGATGGGIDAFMVRGGDTSTSADLVAEYLADVQGDAPRLVLDLKKDDCPRCQGAMLLIATKSLLSCQVCGYSTTYLDATTSSVSYGDEVEFSSFSYKRLNHFNEWMQQVQAKETTELPQSVVDAVMAELHSRRVQLVDVTTQRVREALKSLRLRKTYEHVAQITMRITGACPPRLTPDMEEMCRLCFIAVQPAFEKHCPAGRKNFLSYSYVLFKIFQLLGYDESLESFSLLKGRDKLAKQDQIFKKICEELDWEFVPSV